VHEEQPLRSVPRVLLLPLAGPAAVEALDQDRGVAVGEANVFARDDGQALPDVLREAGEIELSGPEERLLLEAAADALLHRDSKLPRRDSRRG
jgi:hypothetical protein